MQLRESFPLRTYLGLSLLGVGFGLTGALGGAAVASKATGVRAQAPDIELAVTSEPVSTSTSIRVNTEAAEAPSNDVGFVITTRTGNWFVLPMDASQIPHHGGSLEVSDGVQQVLEPLRTLPAEVRAWRDVKVTVQGTCTDTLREFALLSQLSGDPAYIDEGEGGPRDELGQLTWTAKAVQAHGTTYVAARLEHCDGTYARATGATPAVAFTPVAQGAHIALAEKTLLASAVAKEVRAAFAADQAQMADPNMPAPTFEKLWADVANVSSLEMTDPRTGTSWVAVHVSAEFSCGGPDLNFYGLYRVDGDRLVAISEMKSENVSAIEALVDLDGDGVPELFGSGWLQPTHAFYSAEMETLASYEVPFLGCPC